MNGPQENAGHARSRGAVKSHPKLLPTSFKSTHVTFSVGPIENYNPTTFIILIFPQTALYVISVI